MIQIENKISFVLPACNEAESLCDLLPELKALFPVAEIVVVDDGSTDNTIELCHMHDITVISHPYKKGNGAAIKTGVMNISGDVVVFMDADGQHSPKEVNKLLERLKSGHDMVVGTRTGKAHANVFRKLANFFYNKLASWITSHQISDLTSGFRIVKADKFREFLYLLPNGFSYPTTITMAFFRAGYSVTYVPVTVEKRVGKSHIKPLQDGVRFLLIIFRIAALYSPLKVFFPISFLLLSSGLGYYFYTYITEGRFTNMSSLILLTSIIVFLIGLVSEQITFLIYANSQKK